jgi:hypothetical protein
MLEYLEGFGMRKLFQTMALLLVVITANFAVAQDYVMTISSGTMNVGGGGDLSITLDNNGGNVQGWSYGACNDTAMITCTGVTEGSTTATVNEGGTPDFNQYSVFDEGFTAGVVICFVGCATLAPGTGYELNVASYSCTAEGSTSVSFCNVLGTPAVATVVVVDGASVAPAQNSGTVTCQKLVTSDWVRGDANGDSTVNIGDGIWIISELFLGGAASSCAVARDANDDGNVDAADAVHIFSYRFLNGPMPAAPFPGCGQVSGQTPEECVGSGC